MTICPKHGSEWMDDDFCIRCDEIIEEEVVPAPATTNPFHANNQPLPKPNQSSFVPEKDIILLKFSADTFKYEDRQTGKTVKGKMDVAKQTSFIEKARQNARNQKCKLMVSIGFSSLIKEDYR